MPNHWPLITNQQPIIIEKRESTVVSLAKIIGLVAASPFILAGGIFLTCAIIIIAAILVSSGSTVAVDIAPWFLLGIALCALLPAVGSRVANKHKIKALQDRITFLELELSESRGEVIKLYETIEFNKLLNATPKKTEEKQL